MQQLVISIEKACRSDSDLAVVRREMVELQECHTKLREDYCDFTEGLMKAQDISFKREVQWKEKQEELATAQVEISCMHGQLACAPAIWDSVFAYGHTAGIVRLRTRLLNDLSTDLRALDRHLFNPEIVSCSHIDTFRREDILDAFVGVPPLMPPDGDSASIS